MKRAVEELSNTVDCFRNQKTQLPLIKQKGNVQADTVLEDKFVCSVEKQLFRQEIRCAIINYIGEKSSQNLHIFDAILPRNWYQLTRRAYHQIVYTVYGSSSA